MRIVHIFEAIVKFMGRGGWDDGHLDGCWTVPVSCVFSMLGAKVLGLSWWMTGYRQEMPLYTIYVLADRAVTF